MDKIALIPAYEPDQILLQIVNELRSLNFDVVVVDDGSGPQYKDIFDKISPLCKFITYDKNHGKGYALKKGLKYIYKSYEANTVIVTMDADGQHQVSDALKLYEEVKKNKSDIVIGSRQLSKDSPLRSRLGNSITRFIYRLITGSKVYDTQSGLRAFKLEQIPKMLEISGERYEYEMNVLLEFSKKKLVISEYPITTIYFDKKNSISHFNTVSDSIKIYSEIFKFVCSSLSSFSLDYGIYSLLLLLLGNSNRPILTANFGARAVSSLFNFTLNKRIVFQTKGDVQKEAIKYFGLVIFNICINTLILTAITALGCNAFAAKIIAEMTMFVLSYTVQHFFIFKRS